MNFSPLLLLLTITLHRYIQTQTDTCRRSFHDFQTLLWTHESGVRQWSAAPDPAPTELGAESAGIEVRMYTMHTF